MAISGRLEDTSLPSLLQVLSQGHKSGRLSLARGADRAVILLREGKLIYAASSSVRETLGNILVCEKLITEAQLLSGLERQHASRESVRLGSVLLETGAISPEDLRSVLEEQTMKVLRELIQWPEGFFKFDGQSVLDEGLQSFDLDGFLVDEGLRIDRALLTLGDPESSTDAMDAADPDFKTAKKRAASVPIGLREVSHYLNQPVLTAEMTVALLRYASGRADRVLLLMHHDDRLRGIAQAGVEIAGEQPDARVRDLNVPTAESSVFREAIEQRESVRGSLDDREIHRHWIEQLGGHRPAAFIVVPMVVQNEVAFLLYADSLQGEIADAEHLEVLMLQAGLSMEKAMLELRVETLEDRLGKMPPAKVASPPGDVPASSSLVAQLLAGKPED